MDIIRYYLIPNSTALKLSNQKQEYIVVQKLVNTLYINSILFLLLFQCWGVWL